MSDVPMPVLIVVAVILTLTGFVSGHMLGADTIRREAVTKGYAHYIPDKDGNPAFTWGIPK
jgi:hypothetical protein